MILIGQDASPFVRRVGIALQPDALPVFRTIAQKFVPPVGPAAAA
jgi:hypothetical protein